MSAMGNDTVSAECMLYYLPGSPWSVRARFALGLCKIDIPKYAYRPYIDQLHLWAKLGFPWKKITVPVLFVPKSEPLCHGVDIARFGWTLSKNSSECPPLAKALFPDPSSEENVLLEELLVHADVISSYCRSYKLQNLAMDPERVTREWVPRSLQNRWFSPYLGKVGSVAISLFMRKYDAASRSDALAALLAVRKVLNDSRSDYLLGGDKISYADIAVATSMFFTIPSWSHGPMSSKLSADFQDLASWRHTIFSFYPGDEAHDFSFLLKQKTT